MTTTGPWLDPPDPIETGIFPTSRIVWNRNVPDPAEGVPGTSGGGTILDDEDDYATQDALVDGAMTRLDYPTSITFPSGATSASITDQSFWDNDISPLAYAWDLNFYLDYHPNPPGLPVGAVALEWEGPNVLDPITWSGMWRLGLVDNNGGVGHTGFPPTYPVHSGALICRVPEDAYDWVGDVAASFGEDWSTFPIASRLATALATFPDIEAADPLWFDGVNDTDWFEFSVPGVLDANNVVAFYVALTMMRDKRPAYKTQGAGVTLRQQLPSPAVPSAPYLTLTINESRYRFIYQGRTPIRGRQRASGVMGTIPLRGRQGVKWGLRGRQNSNL